MSIHSGKATAPFHAPEIQLASAAELAAMRDKALEALLAEIRCNRDGFYASRNGTANRLADLPLLSPADLLTEITGYPPFGRLQLRPEPPIRAGLATACVPRPAPIFWSQRDLDAEAQLGARAFWRAGLRPRGRSSDCLDGGLVTPGTLAIADALDALDALALPVGPVTSAAALERVREVWKTLQPRVLILAADSFAFLDGTGALADVTAIVLLTPEQDESLAAPSRSNVYRILSIPLACTFLAGECEAHDGYHVAEDAVAVEILDPSGTPLPDGARGRLVISTLNRSAAVLRLDSGMRASLNRAPCSCGETHARLQVA
jgi:phenylacetate-CoA ligase